ncbi:hypothetical protein a10_05530 [Streptomyces acidiscabies]|nr:hypothetical protein a10_05530 [Streptomyces acidiscabies]
MRAVLEPALPRERLDLGEHLPDPAPGVPETDTPQARRVDEDTPGGEREEVAGRRGVPPLAVDVAGGLDVHDVVPGEGVREGGLPGTGGTEEDTSPAPNKRVELPQALTRERTDSQHRHTGRRTLDVLHQVRENDRVGHEISLAENHDRLRPGLPGKRQVPLHTPEIELDGKRNGDHDMVDVGGEDLPLGPLGGRGPHERGPPRQQRPYVARVFTRRIDDGPVPGAHDLHGIARHDELGVGTHHTFGGDDVTHPPVDTHNTPENSAR